MDFRTPDIDEAGAMAALEEALTHFPDLEEVAEDLGYPTPDTLMRRESDPTTLAQDDESSTAGNQSDSVYGLPPYYLTGLWEHDSMQRGINDSGIRGFRRALEIIKKS